MSDEAFDWNAAAWFLAASCGMHGGITPDMIPLTIPSEVAT
jgi:hypothetical protein